MLAPLPEGPSITPYLRFQLDRAWRQDAARREVFARARTEAEIERLKADLRRKVLAALGGLPAEKTPLDPRVTGTIAMDGYRIEKVVFESLSGFHVTALLYVPETPAEPRPAVLVACGHSPLGKAFQNYQEVAARLAKRGYVVLCWDPVGQGERSQFWDTSRGRSRYNLVCGEHAVLGNLATLVGANLARWMVWDGIRAVDYLLTRPEVDPTRLSITGTSGGGFQSTYIGGLDERIGVVAPSCFPTALPMRMANRIFEDPDSDPEQDPYGLVSEGIDHAGLLLLTYPRPLHVAAAVKDFFPIEGTRATMRELAAFYGLAGIPDRVVLKEGHHGHSYSPENQESAFLFLDRFNRMPPRPGLEEVRTLEPEALRCTPSGQVRVDLPGRALTEIIREYARDHRPPEPVKLADLYYDPSYPGIREWPVVPFDGRPARDTIAWEALGRSDGRGFRIHRYALHHSEGLQIPLLHITRGDRLPVSFLLHFGFEGKATPRDWPEIQAYLDRGLDVVSFDPRGLGENRMRFKAVSIDDPDLAPRDEDEAYLSPLSGVFANHAYNALLTGRPYLLELIEDAEVVARFARGRLGATRLMVTARGEARAAAAAVARALPGVDLEARPNEGLFAWSEAVEEMREIWPIPYLLPGGAYVEDLGLTR